MQSFEQIRSHVGSRHALRTNDPYLISFDLDFGGRLQGMYLAEMDDEDGAKYLRISTPIGPFTGMDGVRGAQDHCGFSSATMQNGCKSSTCAAVVPILLQTWGVRPLA